MKFYGYEYWGNRATTTGDPNPYTGRLSTAGNLAVFSHRSDRDAWVARDGQREAVTAREARRLHAGMTRADYDDYIRWIIDDHRMVP